MKALRHRLGRWLLRDAEIAVASTSGMRYAGEHAEPPTVRITFDGIDMVTALRKRRQQERGDGSLGLP